MCTCPWIRQATLFAVLCPMPQPLQLGAPAPKSGSRPPMGDLSSLTTIGEEDPEPFEEKSERAQRDELIRHETRKWREEERLRRIRDDEDVKTERKNLKRLKALARLDEIEKRKQGEIDKRRQDEIQQGAEIDKRRQDEIQKPRQDEIARAIARAQLEPVKTQKWKAGMPSKSPWCHEAALMRRPPEKEPTFINHVVQFRVDSKTDKAGDLYIYTKAWDLSTPNRPVFQCSRHADGWPVVNAKIVLWLHRAMVNMQEGWIASHASVECTTVKAIEAGHSVFAVPGHNWLHGGNAFWKYNNLWKDPCTDRVPQWIDAWHPLNTTILLADCFHIQYEPIVSIENEKDAVPEKVYCLSLQTPDQAEWARGGGGVVLLRYSRRATEEPIYVGTPGTRVFC